MEKTILPSWCTPVPPHIGDKAQGKISADRWHVFCTVYLIVTLGHLWGSLPPDNHENQLFMNFCDLIMATKITTGRFIYYCMHWRVSRSYAEISGWAWQTIPWVPTRPISPHLDPSEGTSILLWANYNLALLGLWMIQPYAPIHRN